MSAATAVICREKILFDIFVKPVQYQIGKDRANHASLRNSTQGIVVVPFFQVACFQEILNQAQEAVIMNFLLKDVDQNIMIDPVETSRNIPFDKPLYAFPVLCYLLKSSMTPATGPKAVRVNAKLGLVVGFQDRTNYFL